MRVPVSWKLYRSVLLFLWLAIFSASAFADIDSSGVLDDVLNRYSTVASSWGTIIKTRATWLFWTLALISMVWTFGMMALRKADLAEFYAEFVRFTIFTGFYWWLLTNGPTFATSIMDSLRQIGAEATRLGSTLTPSGIVDIGFGIFGKMVEKSSIMAPVDSGIGILISVAILVVFALVSVNMLILLISSWFLAYAGIFFLGFGGSRWTSELAIGYFRTVLNIAAQLFTMVLLVGIGKSFIDQYYTRMSGALELRELGVMLVVAVVMLALVKTIPGLIGGLAGGNTGSLGSGFGAGAALGAAAMGAAALGAAGAAISAGAAGMAAGIGGGAQALMAAFSKAGAAASGGGGGSGSGSLMEASGSSGAGSDGESASGSNLSAAMGDSDNDIFSPFSSKGSTDFGGATATGSQEAGSTSNGGASEKTSPGAGAAGGGKGRGALAAAGAAAAKVGKIAVGTAVNLAQGSMDVAGAKVSGLKDAAMNRIGQSTGGKIASAIKARDVAARAAADNAGSDAQFDGNSLSGGSKSSDAESEVAAFRDRK